MIISGGRNVERLALRAGWKENIGADLAAHSFDGFRRQADRLAVEMVIKSPGSRPAEEAGVSSIGDTTLT